jgi:hypothetical protein
VEEEEEEENVDGLEAMDKVDVVEMALLLLEVLCFISRAVSSISLAGGAIEAPRVARDFRTARWEALKWSRIVDSGTQPTRKKERWPV